VTHGGAPDPGDTVPEASRDDWYRRDLRILERVALAEVAGAEEVTTWDLAAELGLDQHDVTLGLQALKEADFVHWNAMPRYGRDMYKLLWPRLKERGRRTLRKWPVDGYDALLAILEERIEAEREPDERSKLMRLLTALRGMSRDVAVEVIAAMIMRGSPSK
jgi:DNA-binding MarR family transcriptional regulator